MEAICTIGAAIRPVKNTYMMRSPTVIRPASTSPPPTMIISTPIPPTIAVANAPVPEMAVIDCATLRKRRCAPAANTYRSRRSALYALTMRMPPSVSASRPVTSALILPRSRKSGRSRLKKTAIPPPNRISTVSVTAVSFQLSQKSTPTAISAVTNPPTSCTSPVPTRFRMPSASDMMREMSTPVLVESK